MTARKPTPAELARKMADSAAEDVLNTSQAIELAKAYALMDLANAVRANTNVALSTPRTQRI